MFDDCSNPRPQYSRPPTPEYDIFPIYYNMTFCEAVGDFDVGEGYHSRRTLIWQNYKDPPANYTYIYIYIYIYIRMSVHTHAQTCTCTHVYIYIYICIYTIALRAISCRILCGTTCGRRLYKLWKKDIRDTWHACCLGRV